jgi:hypothetical protein
LTKREKSANQGLDRKEPCPNEIKGTDRKQEPEPKESFPKLERKRKSKPREREESHSQSKGIDQKEDPGSKEPAKKRQRR